MPCQQYGKKIKAKIYSKIPGWLSTMEAFIHPNLVDFEKIWTYKDILDIDGKLKSKQELENQGINLSWWAHLQIQSRYEKDVKMYGFYKDQTVFDKILLTSDEKLIKKMYNFLLILDMESEQVKETMTRWANFFGYNIELEKWQMLWERNYKLTMSTSYKENLYKMFYRWHLPPARLAKMFKNMSDRCWKCKHNIGTYYHIWWTCGKAKAYWRKIHMWLEKILGEQVDFKPELFLLGIMPEKTNKQKLYLILHITTAARIIFAQYWKNEGLPSEEEIIRKILECAEMDRLTMRLKDKEDTDYYQIWNLFYSWLEKRMKD